MPSLKFQPRFVEAVESGRKRQTIRPPRKRPIMAGDTLYLSSWTGSPYRSPVKLLAVAICLSVQPIVIGRGLRNSVCVSGRELEGWEKVELAHADGFKHLDDMLTVV
jgi:hypothetical protein